MHAIVLQTILRKRGYNISKNKINEVLKMLGYAKEEKNKQKRKKWIRYERKHSRAGILTGFITRKWIIAYLDDASRLITGYRVFDNATLKCHKCLKEAMGNYGKPESILTDKAQFYASAGKKAKGISRFESFRERNKAHCRQS